MMITRRRWTELEMEVARHLYREGLGKEEIAERLGRTPKSIEVRVSLYKDYFNARIDKPDYVHRPTLWERIRGWFA